ncbi:MAG TPA: hypothetical protein VFV38_10895 [Ktedonobacteraceae bacterium]|nr:hypothetical protein [Ktedonobacteraceae bacterium]
MQLRGQTWPGSLGKGKAFGTFGELLQGAGKDDQDFLVTLPIDRFSTARFLSIPQQPRLTVSPSQKYKAERLATLILEHYRLPPGGILELESTLPVGKGLASSSADLVAVVRAIDNCFALHLSVEQLQCFLRQIEPTDGVMYEGTVAYYHRNVSLYRYLGQLPELVIVSIDEGGEVDTIEFNKKPKAFSQEEKEEYEFLLRKIERAIREQDLRAIGEVSLQSAILNQKLHKKQYFEQVRDICQQVEGLGVVVAHSGTYLGILLSPQEQHFHRQLHHAFDAMRRIADNVTLFHSRCQVFQTEARNLSRIGGLP